MKQKLRRQYKMLTLLLFVTYAVLAVLGWLNTNDFDDLGSTMWLFGLTGTICFVFSILAFIVCIPKDDQYEFKKNKTKVAAEVAAASIGSPVGGIGDGFRVGPRARYIAPILIIGAIIILGSIEMLPLFNDYTSANTSIVYFAFILSIIAEVFAIYAAIVCRKYNQSK